MLSPRMIVAVRVMALKRHIRRGGWIDALVLVNVHGVRWTTLHALARKGIVRERRAGRRGAWRREFRLADLPAAIIDAVRA